MKETLSERKRELCNVKHLQKKKLEMNATINPCSITNTNQLGKAESWHYRMGHAALHTLINSGCISKNDTKENRVCVVCPMAKFTKLPYSLSASYAAEHFQPIHVDIWGAYKVKIRGKHKSDNGTEFEDRQCKALFGKLGIIHQTSSVDRPQ